MRSGRERLFALACGGAAALVAAALGWIVVDVAAKGLPRLSPAFLVEAPRDAGRAGGVGPVVVSTLAVVCVCLATALPLALAAGARLAELDPAGRGGRAVRRSLDVLAATPSIAFGLFGNALFCRWLGLGYSVLSGGLTLACMVLPLLVRTTEASLRAAPPELREGAAALALSRWTTLRAVLLPAALPGIAAGVVLALGRALAETAALLFTSGYVARAPRSLLDGGRTLSVHVYDLAANVPGGGASAHAAALVLLGALALLHAGAWSLAARLGRRAAA